MGSQHKSSTPSRVLPFAKQKVIRTMLYGTITSGYGEVEEDMLTDKCNQISTQSTLSICSRTRVSKQPTNVKLPGALMVSLLPINLKQGVSNAD